ncbi:MAG: hypothetical protein ACPL5I_03540 [Thermodesulfobacteriota bacterium]
MDLNHCRSMAVIPAQAGIQFFSATSWIPVSTGMTILTVYCSVAHGRPHSNPEGYGHEGLADHLANFRFAWRLGVSTTPDGDTKDGSDQKWTI